ncbi:sensor domain-containing diguanylate cyclase [Salisediminibacterium beveridgei]|uniref:Diguanylate cyclase/phosphodiesterase (GGDEF & EAL domains) with PAS/PAC sensor(S) n=1 Tax=Salisediminibacterium beveridgei TaxID=632773 RepID=A0A1D7QWH5_9BACI|nr:PAS domain S-box protein [Salisediminibacterium beveridgei]AOM83360.1 diguanylate cyclase/phosphodiesterase (GGDEF & EAL domains) with PAS/PAC sensor(s) [Salisediminibacterium beveridgei]
MSLKIQDPVIESSMEEIRETLLQRILLSILAVGLIFIVVNFINEWILGSIQMTYPVLILYILLLIIYGRGVKIPFQFRAYIVISVLFATGVVSSLTYGMIGLSILFYVGASYTAMLLLSRKETIWWMGMSLSIYLVIYSFWVSGILTYGFSVEEYSVSITTMLSRLVAFIFFVGLMIFSQWMVNQFLVDKMNKLKKTHDELVESDQRLHLQYEALAVNREALKLKEEQYRSIIENTPDLIYALSKNREMVTANSAMIRFLGDTEESVIHQPISKLAERYPLLKEMHRHVDKIMSSNTPFQFVTRVNDEITGNLRTYHSVITPVKKESGELNLLLFKHHDVTELLLKDEKIEHLAFFDQLTGLSNRTHFEQVATSLIEQNTKIFAMIYFDLDHFKKK